MTRRAAGDPLRRPDPRPRQARGAQRDPPQARAARRRRVGGHAPPHDRRCRDAGQDPLLRGRPQPRARPPRALGRRWLPRRPAGRRDPGRRSDPVRLRQLQRDDHQPPLPGVDDPEAALEELRRCSETRSSTRGWSTRSSGCCRPTGRRSPFRPDARGGRRAASAPGRENEQAAATTATACRPRRSGSPTSNGSNRDKGGGECRHRTASRSPAQNGQLDPGHTRLGEVDGQSELDVTVYVRPRQTARLGRRGSHASPRRAAGRPREEWAQSTAPIRRGHRGGDGIRRRPRADRRRRRPRAGGRSSARHVRRDHDSLRGRHPGAVRAPRAPRATGAAQER